MGRFVDIDEDGEISIRSGRPEGSTWYVSAGSVTIVGWLTDTGKLRGAEGSDELGQAMESLYEERRLFRPVDNVRLFFFARDIPDKVVDATVSKFRGPAIANVFTNGLVPSQ